ncbi:MAG: S41 family peptidase [Myxococcota bacterium]
MMWTLWLGCRATGSPTPAAEPSPSDDVRRFAAFIEAVHPEPMRFVDEATFRRTVDEQVAVLDGLTHPDQFEVGRAFQNVIAVLGDFHAQVGLPAYQSGGGQGLTLLPLVLRRVEGRLYVHGTSMDWPKGTELLRIQGLEAQAIWDALRVMVSVDGRRPHIQETVLNYDFIKYFHLRYGVAQTYDIVVRLPDGTEQAVTLDGIEPDAFRTLVEPSGVEPQWPTFERVDDETVWLRLPSFGNSDAEAYTARVQTGFESLTDIKRLVVDVRGNPGGFRGLAVSVLNHLLPEPYVQWRGVSARVKRIPKVYEPYTEFFIGEESDLKPMERPGDPIAPWLRPVEPQFTGDVVLFADARTNSAANSMALALLHYRPDVVFIGEELGGDCDRHAGNLPVLFRAPQSGVSAVISLMSVKHLEVDDCVPGEGLHPDVPVRLTLEDYLQGIDPFWAALP